MRTQGMPGILLVVITATLGPGMGSGAARAATWCAISPGSEGESMRCGIESYEACRTEIRGTGGTSVCTRDPYSQPVEDGPPAPQPDAKASSAPAQPRR